MNQPEDQLLPADFLFRKVYTIEGGKFGGAAWSMKSGY
jgi:hypothetical protein